MKKNLFFLALFITACSQTITVPFVSPGSQGSQALATLAIEISPTWPTPVPTETPVPTATIGYQATAVYAQQTANAAMRLMVDATSSAEQRRHEELSWTVTAAWNEYQLALLTATAYSTVRPATETQMAIVQTQVMQNSTAMVMTWQAPTQIVLVANAESEAKWAPFRAAAQVFSVFGLGLFFLILALWLIRQGDKLLEQVPVEKSKEPVADLAGLGTVVTVRSENHGYPRAQRLVVPCSTDQFTALAQGLIRENRTLAINQWEGAGRPFTRNSYLDMRHFLQSNRLTISTGRGELELTAEGESFFRAWLDRGSVPPPFVLEPMDEGIKGKVTHTHENHTHEPEGEGLFDGFRPIPDVEGS